MFKKCLSQLPPRPEESALDRTNGDVEHLGDLGIVQVCQFAPEGAVVVVGGPKDNRWLGPLSRSVAAVAYSPFVRQPFGMFIADLRPADLRELRELMAVGQLRTVIDGRFDLDEIRTAMTTSSRVGPGVRTSSR